MAINIEKYVQITSGVGGASLVPSRQLVGRFFTNNSLVAPDEIISFSSYDDVANFFGSSSEEAQRANFYFSWVSKSITRPNSMQFARYAPTGSEPMILSASNNNPTLLAFNAINSGAFNIVIGSDTANVSGVDLSAATDLNNVASIIQDSIRDNKIVTTLVGATTSGSDIITMSDTTDVAVGQLVVGVGIPQGASVVTVTEDVSIEISTDATVTDTGVSLDFFSSTDAIWAYSTVTFNPTTQGFTFVAGDFVTTDISVSAPDSGTDLTPTGLLGWFPSGTSTSSRWIAGTAPQTIDEALALSFDASTNFGTFTFLDSLSLSNQDIVDAASWNATKNVMFMYSVGTSSTNAPVLQALLSSIPGVAITVSDIANEYPEQAPMMIAAATNYDAINSVQNYMYQMFPGLTPSVTTTSEADFYDALYINYYGQTQTAGQFLSFYQRGFLQGEGSSVITDMNVYMNEVWLKDAATAALLNLLLALNQIGADDEGRAQVLTALQGVIDRALLNGVISTGKRLTDTQKLFIQTITNNDTAWHQVETSGYWIDCVILESTPNEFVASYTLIYSKDDVVRKIEGRHILI